MELIEIMKVVELFRGLDADQLARLAQIARAETYNEGETIIDAEQGGDQMYILGEGQVEIHVTTAKIRRPTLYLGQGQIFGEIALLDAGARSATVIAAQDGTVVYGLPRPEFMGLCQADTALGFIVMRNLALDLSFKLRHRNLEQL